ncbi:Adenylyl-sulfate kinase [Pararobbsia alpina]|uniref:adenylyl-sulfate kinase n=1 Tax=Pararobbsia alpina TaxID=621374 RepID=UPI0039A44BBA
MITAQTLWFTGLSGSGKSTLASASATFFRAHGLACEIVDGDVLRDTVCADLGFSREDRRENIRRAAVLCRDLNERGIVAIAALISPYREDREMACEIVGAPFKEIWVATPIAECERRDPKGLYRKARAGDIPSFTGISAPYERPLNPDLVVHAYNAPISECVATIDIRFGLSSLAHRVAA